MQSLLSNESTGLLEEDTKKMVQHQQQPALHQQALPVGPECSGCFSLINERYYLAVNDRVWHLNCLRCIDCKLCLDSQQSCFSKDGFIYCKDDYFKRFPRKCNGCNQNINSNELIMKARNFLFHIQCFKCLLCDKLLNPGDEFGIDCRDDYSILCKTHYFLSLQQHQMQQQQQLPPSLPPPPGEFEQITPYNSNIKVELSFDESNKQIIPAYTQQQLPTLQQMPQIYTDSFNQSNLFNNTNTNNANDKSSPSFNNSNGSTNSKGRPKKRKLGNNNTNEQPVTKKQAKSKQMLLNTENNKLNNNNNSNNANNNNVKTTSSATFNKQVSMNINSEALTNNNLLVNQHQINNQLIQAPLGEPHSDFSKNFENNLEYCGEDDDNNNNQSNDNTNDDDEDAEDDDDDLLLDISHGNSSASLSHQSDLLMGPNGTGGSGNSSGYYGSVAAVAAAAQRQKRMRTSFKHHQLRVMKSYFELNHNPDAKDLKQLSQKTGLSKRVLQVWFQNARAKFRRGQGGPCDQMNNGTSSSQQMSPNVCQSFASSNELGNMNGNSMLFQKQHLDMIDEASSQSLSENPNNKAILSSSSSISSSSSLSLNINNKSESSYSFIRHNDGYPFQDQQQSLHI